MTQKEYLDLMCRGLRAEIKSHSDLIDLKFSQVIEPKLDEIIKRQDKANGCMEKLDKKTKFAQWVQGHPKTSGLIFVLSICAIVVVVNVIGLKEVISILK